ncbi:hypothetical protein SmJEL517_g04095 [Synchytrium microbalum]|uniref:G-protein coupled receptors family 1 profile domain-containing protein n=1 Tax=Synchytrium microbalum TaxID=1806994 RepID=A0A507C1F0_9FUNG|nr:uncharacterized protein SmJEL517_g04095 [Synchytrium microbalum]TPX32889.1 hypothetical protein SmJEL517_g04095 [Synchytrium microbalum]
MDASTYTYPWEHWKPLLIFYVVLYVVSAIVNGLLLAALLSDKNLWRTRKLFYLNVALAHCLFVWNQFILSCVSLQVNGIIDSQALCYYDAVLLLFCVSANVVTFIVVALDRWLIIVKGVNMSPRYIALGCVTAWGWGFFSLGSILIDQNAIWQDPPFFCFNDWSSREPKLVAETVLEVASVFIGVSVTFYFYSQVIKHIKQTKKRMVDTHLESARQYHRQSSHVEALTTSSTGAKRGKTDPEIVICRKFWLLTVVSLTTATPQMIWLLYELISGQKMNSDFGAVSMTLTAAQPLIDCSLIIYMDLPIRNKILSWFRWKTKTIATEGGPLGGRNTSVMATDSVPKDARPPRFFDPAIIATQKDPL